MFLHISEFTPTDTSTLPTLSCFTHLNLCTSALQSPLIVLFIEQNDFRYARVGVSSEPDVNVYDITQEDRFIIMASDGVWEFLSSSEAVKIVDYGKNIEDGCRQVSILSQLNGLHSALFGLVVPEIYK